MDDQDEDLNFWPGVADFMLSLFAMALVLLVVFVAVYHLNSLRIATGTQKIIEEQGRNGLLQKSIALLKEQLRDKQTKVEELNRILEATGSGATNLATEKVAMTHEIQELEARIGNLESQIQTLKGEKLALANKNEAIVAENAKLLAENARLAAENLRLEESRKQLEATIASLNDKQPLITINDPENLNFASGSAVISPGFRTQLQREHFVKALQELQKNTRLDTIEFVGHTDSLPLSNQEKGNLDAQLKMVIDERSELSSLRASSNAELGLIRAVAVRNEWVDWIRQREGLTREISIRCYSAADTAPITPGARDASGNDRRIEIRFAQLSKKESPKPVRAVRFGFPSR